MILMIDNYDSFTFNLVQYLGELTKDKIVVYRNDKITIEEIIELSPQAILISPGPCTPQEAGISVEVVKKLGSKIPILGVCLGHQSIGVAYGGKIVRAPYLMHGKTSQIYHNGEHIFKNIPSPFTGMRYHSLIIDKDSCPSSLSICAQTEDGIIMGVSHKSDPVFGVQFHPESILTAYGKILLKNFLDFSSDYMNAKKGK